MGVWTGETERGRLIDDKDIKILSPEDVTFVELAEKTGGIPQKIRETGDEMIGYPQYGATVLIEGSFYQSPKRTAYRIYTSDELGEDTLTMLFENTLVIFRDEDTSATCISHKEGGRFHLFTIGKDNGYTIDKYKPLDAISDEQTRRAAAQLLILNNAKSQPDSGASR